jgi:hypothetical protein
MEKLIDLGKYIEIELINWKITFPDCGELLIAISWTVDSMNDVLRSLYHYCIGSRGLIMLMPVKVLLKGRIEKGAGLALFAVLDYC